MRPTLWIPIAMFLAGVAAIAFAVATGEADVSLIIIFPVFSGSSLLFLVGTLLLISSFISGFALMATEYGEPLDKADIAPKKTGNGSRKSRTEFGGVVLVGPIPIAFGSDKRMAMIMLIVGIVLAVILLGVLFSPA